MSSSPENLDFDASHHSSITPMSGRSSPWPATSTAPSTPPPNALSDHSCATSEFGQSVKETDHEGVEEEEEEKRDPLTWDESETSHRLERLQFVLKQSAVYSSILGQRMEEEREKQRLIREAKAKDAETTGKKRGRPANDSSPRNKKQKNVDGDAHPVEATHDVDDHAEFQQPSLITGAQLKPYQLDGLQWMVSLDQNGISGILADEMGLGKTLQTIAFSAYLRERKDHRPFLVVCPLSVLHNWVDEYAKFAPDIPVCMYHGTPAERAELRKTVMALPGQGKSSVVKPKRAPKPRKTASSSKKQSKRARGRPRKSEPKRAKVPEENAEGLRRSGRARKSTYILESSDEEEEQEEQESKATLEAMDTDEPEVPAGEAQGDEEENKEEFTATFPIILTTYEIIIKDRVHLQRYNWGYIVVDEGHRLKNLDCKLMQEIKKYKSAGRMILTGTPLHNNLGELWSLLNFILPDIFNDLDAFQEWFNLPELQSSLPTNQSQHIISSLHAILKPFLLRRLKVDVETNLPPKKEYVLYAPLSVRQREAYDRVLDGGLRSWLIKGGTEASGVESGIKTAVEEKQARDDKQDEDEGKEDEGEEAGNHLRASRRLAKSGRKSYDVDGDDDEYFEMLENNELDGRGIKVVKTREEEEEERLRMGREHQVRVKVKQVNNMKLQNTVMQLRKVCSHPFLFDWPIDPETGYPVLGEELLSASGKMMVLDRLLQALFKNGHKVLIFSQFTTMLNIIEDWATDFMGWPICRIDGSTPPLERREQMNRFQTGGDDPKAPKLFLLSTRAGGLGINLTAADTVIFYDQDWNPQMDAQAQDRAHRIGQTRPVLIYRLVSKHTVETKIMERATEKRKLEALVIAKGKFRMPAAAAPTTTTRRETVAEMAASLLRLEGEKIEVVPDTQEGKQSVLSDADLEMLLDRSPHVFEERKEGWTPKVEKDVNDSQTAKGPEGSGKKATATFAVYQAPAEEGNDALAKMMGEDHGD